MKIEWNHLEWTEFYKDKHDSDNNSITPWK